MTEGGGFDVRAHYVEVRVPRPDARRGAAPHVGPRAARRLAAKTYPILLLRSPFGVGPYGPDEYFPVGAQTEALLAGRATSSSARTSAAASCPRASSRT